VPASQVARKAREAPRRRRRWAQGGVRVRRLQLSSAMTSHSTPLATSTTTPSSGPSTASCEQASPNRPLRSSVPCISAPLLCFSRAHLALLLRGGREVVRY
jgi:hypothetical protein